MQRILGARLLTKQVLTAVVRIVNILNVHFSVLLAASLDGVHALLIIDLSHLLLFVFALHELIVLSIETSRGHRLF